MSATQLKTNIVNKTKPGVDKLIDSLIDFAKPMTAKQLFETTNKALISSRAMALIAMAKDTARKEEHAAAEASDEDIDVDDLLLLEEEELPSNDVNPQQDAAGYEPEKDEEDEDDEEDDPQYQFCAADIQKVRDAEFNFGAAYQVALSGMWKELSEEEKSGIAAKAKSQTVHHDV